MLRRDRIHTETAEATYVSTDYVRMNDSIAFEIACEEDQLATGTILRVGPAFNDDGGDGTPDCHSSARVACGVELSRDQESSHRDGTAGCPFNSGLGGAEDSRDGHNYEGVDETGDDWTFLCSSGASTPGKSSVLRLMSSPMCDSFPPSMEVCLVCSSSGKPAVLTERIQLALRRRNFSRKGSLHAIPESAEVNSSEWPAVANTHVSQAQGDVLYQHFSPISSSLPLKQVKGGAPGQMLDGRAIGVPAYREGVYGYGEEGGEGELSWFNAGVRVGMGLGLGMCIGVGIGVGLLMRTYQATTRSFRRHMF
eukprot:TRINITY_DN1596_c0_g1_i1.p1 TRINITY_DN1596_c0_g1~~TRINITY_DN1596_c0_g1_i1.p1  ORF type:complete len:309 (+),score=29.90 TRINITY_DN1596_c0_g1_i1:443-1369(+)